MAARSKVVQILGPAGAGKATLTGCMLFKYGGIDISTMQLLESLEVKDRDRVYGEAVDTLRSQNYALEFDTQKGYHVTILDPEIQDSKADVTILVLPADAPASKDFSKDLLNTAPNLIILVNKMDTVDWSVDSFLVFGKEKNVPTIPISASRGDNVVEKSPNTPWFGGWTKGGESGFTLLQALDASFQPEFAKISRRTSGSPI